MFNAEQKTRFLESVNMSASSYSASVYTFNQLEPYELKLNKDVCLMTEEELHPILSEIIALRKTSHEKKILRISKYCNWCISENIPGALNSAKSYRDDNADKVRTMMVGDPDELSLFLEELYPTGAGDRIGCIYKCYFWLAFMGVDENDILSIKTSDVNMYDLSVKYKDLELPISRPAIQAFRQAVTATSFTTYHPDYPDKPIIRERIAGDALLRGVKAIPDIMTIRSSVARRNQQIIKAGKTNKKLSYQRVRLSGLFYDTYMLERRGVSPNFKAVAEADIADKNYTGRNYTDNRLRLIKHYTEDYDRWKIVFW